MNPIAKITIYTLKDQMRHKSFYVLLGLSIFFILMIRGCYEGGYSVNGRMVETGTVAWHVSKIVFHLIAGGMYLMAAMLSMKLFSRDREDGSLVLFLSRPVFRRQYVIGRITGTLLLCALFMFLLHLTIVLTVWGKTGAFIPGYLIASLIISINLLFVISCVCFLSLFVPDFISALFTLGILLIGFVSDGGYKVLTSDIVRSAAPSLAAPDLPVWRIVYPKVFMVQAYADSVLSRGGFQNMGPVHPLINLSVFTLLILGLMLVVFHRKEI